MPVIAAWLDFVFGMLSWAVKRNGAQVCVRAWHLITSLRSSPAASIAKHKRA